MSRSQKKPIRKPDRRIPISQEGRISFRPGGKHALDVQIEEAQRVRELLEAELERFLAQLHALAPLGEVADRMETEDEALRRYLAEHYQDFFHVDHLQATFLWLRRRRAIARLQAAQTALSLVRDLLAPDTFVEELLHLLDERSPEEVEVDRSQLTGDAQTARGQIAQYDEQLRQIRTAIVRGNGWIERYYIHKPIWRQEVVQLARAFLQEQKNGTPVPPELFAQVHPEIVECLREHQMIPQRLKPDATLEITFGPYFKYRWREEGKDGPIYTISLGRVSERPEGTLPFPPNLRFSRE